MSIGVRLSPRPENAPPRRGATIRPGGERPPICRTPSGKRAEVTKYPPRDVEVAPNPFPETESEIEIRYGSPGIEMHSPLSDSSAAMRSHTSALRDEM